MAFQIEVRNAILVSNPDVAASPPFPVQQAELSPRTFIFPREFSSLIAAWTRACFLAHTALAYVQHMPRQERLMDMERHVRLFKNGRNQALRIPRDLELPGREAIL